MRCSVASSRTPACGGRPAGCGRRGSSPRSASTVCVVSGTLPSAGSSRAKAPPPGLAGEGAISSASASSQRPVGLSAPSRLLAPPAPACATASRATPGRRKGSRLGSSMASCPPTARPSSPAQITIVGRKRSGTTLPIRLFLRRHPAACPAAAGAAGAREGRRHRLYAVHGARRAVEPAWPVARAALVAPNHALRQAASMLIAQRRRVHHQALHLAGTENRRLALPIVARAIAEPGTLMVQELAHTAVRRLEEIGDGAQANGVLAVDELHAVGVAPA